MMLNSEQIEDIISSSYNKSGEQEINFTYSGKFELNIPILQKIKPFLEHFPHDKVIATYNTVVEIWKKRPYLIISAHDGKLFYRRIGSPILELRPITEVDRNDMERISGINSTFPTDISPFGKLMIQSQIDKTRNVRQNVNYQLGFIRNIECIVYEDNNRPVKNKLIEWIEKKAPSDQLIREALSIYNEHKDEYHYKIKIVKDSSGHDVVDIYPDEEVPHLSSKDWGDLNFSFYPQENDLKTVSSFKTFKNAIPIQIIKKRIWYTKEAQEAHVHFYKEIKVKKEKKREEDEEKEEKKRLKTINEEQPEFFKGPILTMQELWKKKFGRAVRYTFSDEDGKVSHVIGIAPDDKIFFAKAVNHFGDTYDTELLNVPNQVIYRFLESKSLDLPIEVIMLSE